MQSLCGVHGHILALHAQHLQINMQDGSFCDIMGETAHYAMIPACYSKFMAK